MKIIIHCFIITKQKLQQNTILTTGERRRLTIYKSYE